MTFIIELEFNLQLIATSGDAVTNVGKKIALSAQLLPPAKPIGVYKVFGSSSHSGHPVSEGKSDLHDC